MKRAILGLAMLVFGATAAQAQLSNNFAFDATGAITEWDGVPNAYPEDMGGVKLTPITGGYGSGIDVPWQLGYLNNGFLEPCNPITWGAKVWTKGTGSSIGDTFTVHGVTTCPDFTGEYGTGYNSNNRLEGFSVDANYKLAQGNRVCPRYRPCYYQVINALQGGTGTVTDTIIN